MKNRASLGRFFLNVPWEALLSNLHSVDEKLEIFSELKNYGLDTVIPERTTKIDVIDRPWMTSQVKHLIDKRQKSFVSGNMTRCLFKLLRNKVNRERKSYRKVYYQNKVHDLKKI